MRALASKAPPLAPALRGFEHIARHYDSQLGRHVAHIEASAYYVTKNPEILSTVLGSCVATCVHAPDLGMGGMNHFMLPGVGREVNAKDQASFRYGCFAVERLINELVKRGANRTTLQVKVFGGGHVIAARNDVGASNVSFVRDFMARDGLPILAEDVGGPWARRVRYDPLTGKASVMRLSMEETRVVAKKETVVPVPAEAAPGSVELF